jgi:hypothetical protein
LSEHGHHRHEKAGVPRAAGFSLLPISASARLLIAAFLLVPLWALIIWGLA